MLKGEIVWRLGALLAKHGVTPLQVEREAVRLGLDFGKNTIYRLLREDGPQRIDRDTLVSLVSALRSLTKENITVDSLLRFKVVDVIFQEAEPGTCQACQAHDALHLVHRVSDGPVEPKRKLCVPCIAKETGTGELHPAARDRARLGLAPENDP